MSKKDQINPKHYTETCLGMEVFEAMRLIYGDEKFKAFCQLNAFKYRIRAGNKTETKKGITIDISKAKWYENKLSEIESEFKEVEMGDIFSKADLSQRKKVVETAQALKQDIEKTFPKKETPDHATVFIVTEEEALQDNAVEVYLGKVLNCLSLCGNGQDGQVIRFSQLSQGTLSNINNVLLRLNYSVRISHKKRERYTCLLPEVELKVSKNK